MRMAKSTFLDFIRLIVSGETDEVSCRLAASPDLATMPAVIGAFARMRRASSSVRSLTTSTPATRLSTWPLPRFNVRSPGFSSRTEPIAHAKNRRGAELLHYAADANHWDPTVQVQAIEYLLSVGADPNASDGGGVTPLHRAVRTGSLPAVRRCWTAVRTPDQEIRPARRRCISRFSPLGGGSGSEHARQQQTEIIRLLLERGARPSDKDGRGKPVRQAARSEWIRALLVGASG